MIFHLNISSLFSIKLDIPGEQGQEISLPKLKISIYDLFSCILSYQN